ncbi:MAG: xylan 1,4-beta-xylosidase [Lachnospiraceae bacterium]|jgi:xylan 1,4-beta-xylosidase|nr:xylan 1,4-beta-xylosidase [Lachnospiraceae bacterium]
MSKFHFPKDATFPFINNATYCVGTGRMNLALRHEYHEQLKKVQEEIGFSYIRGHGLFHDDMGIYQTYTDGGYTKEEYNFRYVDIVFDDYLALGIKPFVELGFMPSGLASGDQTIFYWKGNTTPPADYNKWVRLVKATVNHWIDRYGREEVITWPFEVWNEPNLAGFWQGADMEEYFKLYDYTSRAVKSCDPRIRVGGPAICGVDDERWLRSFLEFCREKKAPLDFVTRHAYGTEEGEADGHYVYQELRPPAGFLAEPQQSRAIIDSFPEFAGMEMHVTEFNTSYSPTNPIHDTNLNAAYIARVLSELGDTCASYSYWTFGDVFEEAGVAFTTFSGCFGLLANGNIPKPTYWAFAFYKELYETGVARDEHFVITKSVGGDLRGIAWNHLPEGENVSLELTFEVENGAYLLLTKTVDEELCNPLKAWLDMGAPACPTARQLALLKECARPRVATQRLEIEEGLATVALTLMKSALCFFELASVSPEEDRGYRPERIPGAMEG